VGEERKISGGKGMGLCKQGVGSVAEGRYQEEQIHKGCWGKRVREKLGRCGHLKVRGGRGEKTQERSVFRKGGERADFQILMTTRREKGPSNKNML